MAVRINALREITSRYDVVLCDVWGVLHNGVAAFPEASEALIEARRNGVTVVLLTNSPRPNPGVLTQLRGLGVPDEAHDRIVTSGDVTRTLIASADRRIFFIGPDRDLGLINGLDVDLVSADAAHTIVCSGFFDDESETVDDYRATLTNLARRGVPFICANPDLVVERGDRLIPCAGAIAALYREIGGESSIAGKPYPAIYRAALAEVKALRGSFDPRRIIAIGDGMPTDVKGAQDFGLDLLYIANGIHAGEYAADGRIDERGLKAFLARQGATPTAWMPRLA